MTSASSSCASHRAKGPGGDCAPQPLAEARPSWRMAEHRTDSSVLDWSRPSRSRRGWVSDQDTRPRGSSGCGPSRAGSGSGSIRPSADRKSPLISLPLRNCDTPAATRLEAEEVRRLAVLQDERVDHDAKRACYHRLRVARGRQRREGPRSPPLRSTPGWIRRVRRPAAGIRRLPDCGRQRPGRVDRPRGRPRQAAGREVGAAGGVLHEPRQRREATPRSCSPRAAPWCSPMA